MKVLSVKQFLLAILFGLVSVSSVYAETVYVTPKGQKYHYEDCHTLSRSKRINEIDISQAKVRGLTPCKVCRSNERASTSQVAPSPEAVQSASYVSTGGNAVIQSFSKAKKALERAVHTEEFMRITIYCEAPYTQNKDVILPSGFSTEKHAKRSKCIEWEHVVPAENFGRTFSEWREGHSQCVDNKGKAFKGRKCAEKVNTEYRYMQADMYNLYPAIGSVNAMRSNYNFVPMSGSDTFGNGCPGMIIQDRKVSPPNNSRGKIARTYLYMAQAYKRYKMSDSQHQLMNAWNKQYPVTKNECIRTKRIEEIQGNENLVVKELCKASNYW